MHAAMKYVVALGSCAAVAVSIAVVAGPADTSPDKYSVKVPGGLSFSEFKGYESWQVVSLSHGDKVMAAILGNPVAIKAYQSGIPGNGKPFPDGAMLVKIHWDTKQSEKAPFPATVPATLVNAHFQEKDSKRFADSGGWGWAAFEYNATTHKFAPRTATDTPPQGNDAKCGLACHTLVKNRDYVFTEYGQR